MRILIYRDNVLIAAFGRALKTAHLCCILLAKDLLVNRKCFMGKLARLGCGTGFEYIIHSMGDLWPNPIPLLAPAEHALRQHKLLQKCHKAFCDSVTVRCTSRKARTFLHMLA